MRGGMVRAAVAQGVSPCGDGGRLGRMSKQELVAEILALPVEERMELLEAIWDSISAVPEALPLSDAHRAVIDERLEEHRRNPDEGVCLDEALARVRSRGQR